MHEIHYASYRISQKQLQGFLMLCICCHDIVEVSKHGILEVNSDGIVKALVEKPKAEETSSRKAVRKCLKFYTQMCLYYCV